MRTILFYLAALVISLGLVAASLGPQLTAPKPAPQAGAARDGWTVFGPQALAQASVGEETIIHVARGPEGAPAGLRIANRAGVGDPLMHSLGARIDFTPETIAALGPGPWTVEVDLRPLGVTNAETVRIGASDALITEWSEPQAAPAQPETLTFALAATAEGQLAGVSIWPFSSRADYDFGVEVAEIRVRPAG